METFDRPTDMGSEPWLRERFPDKEWHRHRRTDGRTDLCDGTPSDCASKPRIERAEGRERHLMATTETPGSAFERLTKACLDLLPDMPTGFEPAGQSMDTTMRQGRVRDWRKAVMAAAKELTLPEPGANDEHS